MTDEIRRKANQLHSEIQNLEDRIQILLNMNSSNSEINIGCNGVGAVFISAGDYEPAIDYIIDTLKQKKEALKDEYRML